MKKSDIKMGQKYSNSMFPNTVYLGIGHWNPIINKVTKKELIVYNNPGEIGQMVHWKNKKFINFMREI